MIQLDFLAVLEQWPALLRGAGFTLALSAVSAVVGVSLGIACGWVRANGPRWASAIAAGYIELIRNTPFIVQLFFVFFGLPSLGIKLSPELASIIAMVLNLGAYAAEIVRADIDGTKPVSALERGPQRDAGAPAGEADRRGRSHRPGAKAAGPGGLGREV